MVIVADLPAPSVPILHVTVWPSLQPGPFAYSRSKYRERWSVTWTFEAAILPLFFTVIVNRKSSAPTGLAVFLIDRSASLHGT